MINPIHVSMPLAMPNYPRCRCPKNARPAPNARLAPETEYEQKMLVIAKSWKSQATLMKKYDIDFAEWARIATHGGHPLNALTHRYGDKTVTLYSPQQVIARRNAIHRKEAN